MNRYNTDEITSVKEAAIRFDIFIRDGGIGSSMFFVLIMLIIVNTHSLHFLFGDGVLNWVFAIFSAIGFSIATTAVIRKPVSDWMKYLFPAFDTLLVFLGFNLLNDNIPVHFIMTLLFSAFTGAILIGLGTINYKENTKEAEETDYKSKISELELLFRESEVRYADIEANYTQTKYENSKLKDSLSELKEIKSKYSNSKESVILLNKEFGRVNSELELAKGEMDAFKFENETIKTELEKLRTDLAKKTNLLESYEFQVAELDKYKHGYLLAEKSRILKKKPNNRTPEEVDILNTLDKL